MISLHVSLLTGLLSLSAPARGLQVQQKRLFSLSSSPLGVMTQTVHRNLSSTTLPQLVTVMDLEPHMVTLMFQVRQGWNWPLYLICLLVLPVRP